MKLSHLLSHFGIECKLTRDEEIHDLTRDSRCACDGIPFVCINGSHYDGHDFIDDAYRGGARTFFTSRKISGYSDCNVIFVENTRKLLAEAAFFLYGNPEKKLEIIGVTGTKGKSTTAYALFHILKSLKKRAAFVGTLGAYGVGHIEITNTTPTPELIARAMHSALTRGCKYFILEVSSQAIKEERIFGIPFCAGIFTNIGRDHIGIGEHLSLADYVSSKRRLFTDFGVPLAVVNSDDEYAEYMSNGVLHTVRVGEKNADIKLENITANGKGIGFELEDNFCNTTLHGKYNAHNLSLAAVTASIISAIPLSVALSTLENIKIPGRFEVINRYDRTFVIDYAHNSMSFKSVLSECKRLTKNRLIAVFGSVGGRSYERRKELPIAASEYADVLIITSDNPDFESVDKICDEILSFVPRGVDATVALDRAEAIKRAFLLSVPGDVIALLGKGHEQWQTVRGVRLPFSERDVINTLREK